MYSRRKRYQCSSCDNLFSTQIILTEHEQTHKGGVFSCYQCGEVTTTLTKMIIHKRIHATENWILSLGETDRVLDFKYYNSSSRKFVTKIYPGNMDPHPTVKQEIYLNGGDYEYKDNVRIEEENTVEIEIKEEEVYPNKSYLCNQCDEYFSQKDDLIIHQTIHTWEQPYQCSLFDKCLAQISGPYQCNFCDKYVVRKQDLVIHQKIHSGMQYQCSHCDKCFAQKGKMLTHHMIHRVENETMDFHCRVCGTEGKAIGKPLNSKQREILAWMYQLLDFDAERADTQVICRSCELLFKKHILRDYSRGRSDGRHPKYRISVVVWDSDGRFPVYHINGVPYRYSIGPNKQLNGLWRSAKEALADHEVVYPRVVDNTGSVMPTPKVSLCNLCKTCIMTN